MAATKHYGMVPPRTAHLCFLVCDILPCFFLAAAHSSDVSRLIWVWTPIIKGVADEQWDGAREHSRAVAATTDGHKSADGGRSGSTQHSGLAVARQDFASGQPNHDNLRSTGVWKVSGSIQNIYVGPHPRITGKFPLLEH